MQARLGMRDALKRMLGEAEIQVNEQTSASSPQEF